MKPPKFILLTDRAGQQWVFHAGTPVGISPVEGGTVQRVFYLDAGQMFDAPEAEETGLINRAADWLKFHQAPDLRQWLKDRPCLSILCLENAIAAPQGTLAKYVSGERGLAEQWICPLKKALVAYGYPA